MKPEEALQILDNAVATLQVDRNTHARLQQAAMIIKEALTAKTKKEENKKV